MDLHERSFEWADNLDPEERAAVEGWTGDGFESFRGSAQEPKLLQAVARAPEANRTVWRGVRSDALGFRNREDVLAAWDKRIGEVVKEDVFRSATLDPNGAPSFGDVIFEIEGGGGRYIEGATMKSGEHEVLFFAGSRFEILGVDWNAQVRLHDGRVVPRPVIRLRHLP